MKAVAFIVDQSRKKGVNMMECGRGFFVLRID